MTLKMRHTVQEIQLQKKLSQIKIFGKLYKRLKLSG